MECFFDTQNWLNSKQRELKGISAFKIIRMYVLNDFSVLFPLPWLLLNLNNTNWFFFLKRKIKIKSNLLNEAELCITDSNIHLTIAQWKELPRPIRVRKDNWTNKTDFQASTKGREIRVSKSQLVFVLMLIG